MALENPVYLEHPDLPEKDGRPAYQLVPDAPGVVAYNESRGWVVKDLPAALDPDAPNTGLKAVPTPVPAKKEEKPTAKKAASQKEGDEK